MNDHASRFDRDTLKDAERLMCDLEDIAAGRSERDRIRFRAAVVALRHYRKEVVES